MNYTHCNEFQSLEMFTPKKLLQCSALNLGTVNWHEVTALSFPGCDSISSRGLNRPYIRKGAQKGIMLLLEEDQLV